VICNQRELHLHLQTYNVHRERFLNPCSPKQSPSVAFSWVNCANFMRCCIANTCLRTKFQVETSDIVYISEMIASWCATRFPLQQLTWGHFADPASRIMDRNSIFTWLGLSLALLGTILTFSWGGIFNFILAKVSACVNILGFHEDAC
jgi:hypothetical protein